VAESPSASSGERRIRRTFGLISLLVALLIVWVSVIPFNFRPVPAGQIVATVYGLGRPLPTNLSRADILANGIAFAAFGLVAMGTLAFARRGVAARLGALATVLAGGLALSIAVEFAQIFLPGRESSVVDVGTHAVGTLAGAVAFLLVGERFVNWLRLLASERERPSVALRLLALYAVGTAAWRLFPFQFTVRPGTIWQKIEAGHVSIVPCRTWAGSSDVAMNLAALALAAAPLGALALLTGVRPGRRRRVAHAVILAAAFLAVVEGLAVFTRSGTADTGNILVGACGALVGAVLAAEVTHREVQEPVLSRAGAGWLLGVLAWAAVVAAYEWSPFTFRFTKEAIKDGLDRLTLLPFGFYARDAPPAAFLNVARKTLLAVPLGLLLVFALKRQWPSLPRSLRLAFACLAVVLLLTILEAGQILLPERVPESTDVLLPAAAATLAAWLATRQR
jgi:VanZ family protein